MDMTIVYGVTMFTVMVLILVVIILYARSALVSTGDVQIEINGEKTITVPAGGKLLQTLSVSRLFLPPPVVAAAPAPSANASSRKAVARCCPRKRRILPSETPPRAGA